MLSSLMVLLTTVVWGSFPAGCPAENLKSICNELGKISNDKTLVFADGTQMPACYLSNSDLKTADENQRQEALVLQTIYEALKKKYFPIRQPNREEVQNLVIEAEKTREAIQFLRDIQPLWTLSSDPEFRRKIEAYISYKQSARPPKAMFGRDIRKEFEFTQRSVQGLVRSVGNSSNQSKILDFLNEVQPTGLVNQIATKPIPCRPHQQAFFQSAIYGSKKFSAMVINPTMSQYPEPTRLFIMGHELGHAFDPCTKDLKADHPFINLIDCLQNEVGHFKGGAAAIRCDNPHTREAFCDHVGMHVVEEWAKMPRAPVKLPEPKPNLVFMPPGYEYIISLLDVACSEMKEGDRDRSHPAADRRLKDVVLKSPTVAKQLNCKSSPDTYRCDPKQGVVGAKPPWYERTFEAIKRAIR